MQKSLSVFPEKSYAHRNDFTGGGTNPRHVGHSR